MKKTTMKSNISALQKVSARIPKSINEAINFQSIENEDNEMDAMEDDITDNEPMDKHVADIHEEGPNIENFIANMRKESLGIMKALADDPDDAVYQFAKKIFQLADKAHEDQKEGKDINGQPRQNQMQQRPM